MIHGFQGTATVKHLPHGALAGLYRCFICIAIFNSSRIAKKFGQLTSNVQIPCGYSPQVCVAMKGHLVKPSRRSSSFGLRLKIIDLVVRKVSKRVYCKKTKFIMTYLVPIGDVKNSSKSPRLVEFAETTACTCSKYRTSVSVPRQASVFTFKINEFDIGIGYD